MARESLRVSRRQLLLAASMGAGVASLAACSDAPPPGRYTQADIAALAAQREREAARRGSGSYGEQRYRGYRGLAALPWYHLATTQAKVLLCTQRRDRRSLREALLRGNALQLLPELAS